jgi:hypothetical protein
MKHVSAKSVAHGQICVIGCSVSLRTTMIMKRYKKPRDVTKTMLAVLGEGEVMTSCVVPLRRASELLLQNRLVVLKMLTWPGQLGLARRRKHVGKPLLLTLALFSMNRKSIHPSFRR